MPSTTRAGKGLTTTARTGAKPKTRKRKRTRSRRRSAKARQKAQQALRLKRERAAEQRQSEQFTRASVLFREGKFGMARRVLEKVKTGPNAGLGHRARIYIEICNKKKARKRPKLDGLDEHYNYAVKLLNDGLFKDVVRVCNRALHIDRGAAHVHYLKAVAKVLAGQKTGAVAPLRKAIALDPEIRIFAKSDPDMRSVIHTRPFSKITDC